MKTFKMTKLNLSATTGLAALLLAVIGLTPMAGSDSGFAAAKNGPVPFVAVNQHHEGNARLDKGNDLDKDDAGRLDKQGDLDKESDLDKGSDLDKSSDLGGSLLF